MSIAATTPLSLIAFTALAALAVSGCSVSLDFDDDTMRRTETESIDAGGVALIDIGTGNGAVEIVSGGSESIVVRAEMRESDAGDADYSIDSIGDRLVVRGECDSGWLDRCEVGFRVTVPADVDVAVATDNGRIDVDGVAGSIELETDNGAIQGAALSSDDVAARTDNGRVELAFVAAPTSVDVETDNGAVAVTVPADGLTYDVDATSDNGAIDIDVPTDSGATRRIVAETDNGAIDIGQA